MLEKIKNNKILKIIGNILYIILVIFVVMLLTVVIIQRISQNTIAIGGIRLFTIASESMLPEYEIGDVLISKAIAPSQLKEGDNIVYQGTKGSFKGKIITHQVVGIEEVEGKYKITTKGLANIEEDPVIDQDQVYGKIIYKVKSLSFIGKIIQNVYVFYFAIFIPTALLIFKLLFDIIKNMQSDSEDEDDEDDENAEESEEEKKENTEEFEEEKEENTEENFVNEDEVAVENSNEEQETLKKDSELEGNDNPEENTVEEKEEKIDEEKNIKKDKN